MWQQYDSGGAVDYAVSFDPYGVPFEQYVGGLNTDLGSFLSRDPVMGAVGGSDTP